MDGLAEGDVLADRYRLGPVAGHGAMGEVHLAEDLRLVRPVAIKTLRPELARYPDVRQRFGQEARAAARISHPNVVRVYDTGEQGRIPYLVMECLPGTSLVDELAWGTLEPRRVRRVGLDVLGALDAAHRLGVVHRDVKPGNILLTAAVDGPVKVSDFGIAKSADDHSVTDSGALVGTPAYLAPERVAGEPATPASDLYSLGVVLYEALAGRRPYEAETSLALALAIHMGEGPDLLELRPDLDPALVAIVDKALARDPAERWSSAAEMAEALHAWRPRVITRPLAVVDGQPGAAAAGAAALPAAGAAALPAAATPAPTVALSPGDLPAPTVALSPGDVPVAAAGTSGAGRGGGPAGAADAGGFHLDDGSARAQQRRRRTGILCAGAAGLVVLVLVAAAALRSPGRADPGTPPASAEPLAEAPSASTPETSVLASPPSSATPTTRSTRRLRTAATTATTAAPATRPPTTAAPVRVTTTTRRPATTTTRPATTTTTEAAAVSLPGA